MSRFWLALAVAALCAPAIAHDFWMQPSEFVLEEPGDVTVPMFVGHGNDRERWKVAPEHVLQFNSIGPDGLINQGDKLRMNGGSLVAVVPLREKGAYILALQSRSSSSRLPAARFNDYVATEGITPIAEARRTAGEEDTEGVELYSRRAKTIVQVGPVNGDSIARVTSPVNISLEIVPLRHPQALGEDPVMPVRVLFNGEPLPGAQVKLTDLASDTEPTIAVRTDGSGEATFRLPRASKWQMNVVWAEPAGDRDDADFLTTFSSLAFQTL